MEEERHVCALCHGKEGGRERQSLYPQGFSGLGLQHVPLLFCAQIMALPGLVSGWR